MTREVTLAATQFACGWELEANLDTAERLVREAAGQGARIVLLQELFATPYFPITQEARHFALAGPAEDNPLLERFSRLAGELGRRAPRELLRARRPDVLQLRGCLRRRRLLPRRVPQEPPPRRDRLPGEVLLRSRRHWLPGVGHGLRAHRRRHLLGPVVPGERPRDGAARRRGAALPDGDRQRPADAGGRLARCLAAGAARSRDRERGAAGRVEPHRAGGGAGRGLRRRRSASTARPSSPRRPARCSRRRRGTGRRSSRRRSTWTPPGATASTGRTSATAGRTCTARCSRSTAGRVVCDGTTHADPKEATVNTQPSPRGVIACPPHELHEVGPRMLVDALEADGWEIDFFGVRTPLAKVVAAVRERSRTVHRADVRHPEEPGRPQGHDPRPARRAGGGVPAGPGGRRRVPRRPGPVEGVRRRPLRAGP